MASTVTIATLAMPLTSVLASSATRSSVNSLGQLVDPVLHPLADVVVAHPAADERQLARARRPSRAAARRTAGPRRRPAARARGRAARRGDDADGHDGTAMPRRMEKRRCSRSTSGSRARAMSTPMPMRVSIVVVFEDSASSASAPSTASVSQTNVRQSSRNRRRAPAASSAIDAERRLRRAHVGDDDSSLVAGPRTRGPSPRGRRRILPGSAAVANESGASPRPACRGRRSCVPG